MTSGVPVFPVAKFDVAEIDDAAQTFRVDLHLSMRWRDGALLLPTEVTIDPQGKRFLPAQIWRDTVGPFRLARLPFDHQTLPIIVVSLLYGPDQVSLVVANTGSGADSFTVPGWDVDLGEAESGEMLVPALGSSFPGSIRVSQRQLADAMT